MLRSIDSAKKVRIDGEEFPIKDIVPNGDPLNQHCPHCGKKNDFHIECEITQLGFIGDTFVILCTCKSCLQNQGWRYFMSPEEMI